MPFCFFFLLCNKWFNNINTRTFSIRIYLNICRVLAMWWRLDRCICALLRFNEASSLVSEVIWFLRPVISSLYLDNEQKEHIYGSFDLLSMAKTCLLKPAHLLWSHVWHIPSHNTESSLSSIISCSQIKHKTGCEFLDFFLFLVSWAVFWGTSALSSDRFIHQNNAFQKNSV